MSSLVKFTPLCGARSEQPLCYLLEIDEACILLDCGWDETFDVALLRRLIKIAPSIDAVLVTHCDLAHLGALPYIFSKGNMKAKVYATLPVQKMGQLTMYDVFQSRSAKEDFTAFSLADIDNAWDNFVQLRYQQPCSLSGKAEGITVSPLNAGHQIGGALWKITKESEEIVYAVDYNHAQDRHLDGTVLVDLPRPNILITDAYTALDKPLLGGKKAREGALLERVRHSVEQGGNVLLPVDSTGRVLELLIVLDECWQQNHLRHVTLAFVSPESRSTVDMAMSQVFLNPKP
jgi:cleavage and polyadenylation specificity factor subunit 2